MRLILILSNHTIL